MDLLTTSSLSISKNSLLIILNRGEVVHSRRASLSLYRYVLKSSGTLTVFFTFSTVTRYIDNHYTASTI